MRELNPRKHIDRDGRFSVGGLKNRGGALGVQMDSFLETDHLKSYRNTILRNFQSKGIVNISIIELRIMIFTDIPELAKQEELDTVSSLISTFKKQTGGTVTQESIEITLENYLIDKAINRIQC